MKTDTVIYGAGSNGRVVLDILISQNRYQVVGFIDDNKQLINKKIKGIPVFGDSSYLERMRTNGHTKNIFVSIGDNKIRANKTEIIKNIGFNLINAIHLKTIISNSVKLGENVQISAGVIINNDSKIGNNVIINTGTIIDHDNEIGDNVQICPAARLAGTVKIKENTFIGIGALVINNITIGKNVIVGAGAVILKDVPDNVLVVGVPGKICKYREVKVI